MASLFSLRTKMLVIECLFIIDIASTARVVGVMLRGFGVMMFWAVSFRKSLLRCLLKSPSVMIPIIWFWLLVTPVQPRCFEVISRSTFGIFWVWLTSGISLFLRINSDTFRKFEPNLPPGWKIPNCFLLKFWMSIKVTAMASPKASIIVVEVVGALTSLASGIAGSTNATLLCVVSSDCFLLMIPMIGMENLLQ